jgi:hypothetical protein
VQNRAPAASGAPQPAQNVVALAEGADGGGGADGGCGTLPGDGAAGAAIATPVVPMAAGEIVSLEVSVRPHFGHAIQPGCSDARQSGQRPCPNGSVTPQYGHATTAASTNLPQYGQGCLNVGIRTLLPLP